MKKIGNSRTNSQQFSFNHSDQSGLDVKPLRKYSGAGAMLTAPHEDVINCSARFSIEIKDEGVGIAPENLSQLFLDFCKLEATENINKEGTGLGLKICKRIVEQMGGSVEVKSRLGVGTCFKVMMHTNIKIRAEFHSLIGISSK